MAARRILIVEDEPKTAETLRLYLAHAGFEVTVVHDGRRGLAEAQSGRHDLVVLDLMLPGLDGLQICRALRADRSVPIVMLTARSTEGDRVLGLDLGADDYVGKPFSPREVVARVRAVLRRSGKGQAPGAERYRFAGLTVDAGTREVTVRGRPVALTPTEFALLRAFVRFPQRVFTRDELIERALGEDFDGSDRTVDAHVMNLRRKIEVDRDRPEFIQTVFGVGYKFTGERDAP